MWFVKYATSGKVKNYFTKLAKEACFLNPHTNLTEFKVVRSVSCPSPMPCVIFSSSFPGLLHSALKSVWTWWKEGRHRIGKAVPCPLFHYYQVILISSILCPMGGRMLTERWSSDSPVSFGLIFISLQTLNY